MHHFMGLLLESAYESLNLSAVEYCLSNDWQGLYSLLSTMWLCEDPQEKGMAVSAVLFLLLGRYFSELNIKNPTHANFVPEVTA